MIEHVNYRTLGRLGSELLTRLSSEGRTIFSLSDAQDILSNKSNVAVRKLVSRLVKAGWLIRLKDGQYLIVPLEAISAEQWSEDSLIMASVSVSGSTNAALGTDFYSDDSPYLANQSVHDISQEAYAVSYWSALNYYGYTEQIPRTVFVSTPRRQPSTKKEILDIPYQIVVISRKKFFGVTTEWINAKPVHITDKEKTIIDCLDKPKLCGGIIEAAKGLAEGIKDNIDLEKLTAYAEQIGNNAVIKRLGYLSESLDLPVDPWLGKWKEHLSKGYSLLDPTQRNIGSYNARWHLIINVPEINFASKVRK